MPRLRAKYRASVQSRGRVPTWTAFTGGNRSYGRGDARRRTSHGRIPEMNLGRPRTRGHAPGPSGPTAATAGRRGGRTRGDDPQRDAAQPDGDGNQLPISPRPRRPAYAIAPASPASVSSPVQTAGGRGTAGAPVMAENWRS